MIEEVWLGKVYEPYGASWCDVVATSFEAAASELEDRINERNVHVELEWTERNDGYWTGGHYTEIKRRKLHE